MKYETAFHYTLLLLLLLWLFFAFLTQLGYDRKRKVDECHHFHICRALLTDVIM